MRPSAAWCRLQTNTYPHISRLHAIFFRYTQQRHAFGVATTLSHITYQCAERPAHVASGLARSRETLTTWSREARLSELAMVSQLVTLNQARQIAAASRALLSTIWLHPGVKHGLSHWNEVYSLSLELLQKLFICDKVPVVTACGSVT